MIRFVLILLAMAFPLAISAQVVSRNELRNTNDALIVLINSISNRVFTNLSAQITNVSTVIAARAPGLGGQLIYNNAGQNSNAVSALSFPNGALLGTSFRELYMDHPNATNVAEASINQDGAGSLVEHATRINNEGILRRSTNTDVFMTNWSTQLPVHTNAFFPFIKKLSSGWWGMWASNVITGVTGIEAANVASNIYAWYSPDGISWKITNGGNPVLVSSPGGYRAGLYNAGFDVTTNDQVLIVIETTGASGTSMCATQTAWSTALAAGTLQFAWPTTPTFGTSAGGAAGFVLNPCPVYVPDRHSFLLFASGWMPNKQSAASVAVAKPLTLSGSVVSPTNWLVSSNTWDFRTTRGSIADTYAATDVHVVWVSNKAFQVAGKFLFNQQTGVQFFANCAMDDFFDMAFQTNSTRANGSFEFSGGAVSLREDSSFVAYAPTFYTGTGNAPDPGSFTVRGVLDATRGAMKLGSWTMWGRGTLDAPNGRLAFFDPLANEAFTLLSGGGAYFMSYIRDTTLRGANSVTTIEAADGVDIATFGFSNYQIKFPQVGTDSLLYLDGSDILSPVTIGAGIDFTAGTLSATGTGNPAGNSGAVQFNEGGSFAGTNTFTYDRTNSALSVSGGDGSLALTGSGSSAKIKVAPTNNVTVTNLIGLVHQSPASVLVWDANQANSFSITGRITGAVTIVISNTSDGQIIDGEIIGEIAGGTSRVVTIVPHLGHLISDEDDFSAALATSTSFTLTNGNKAEFSGKIRKLNGTNTMGKVVRQSKF